jgi:heparanase 1
MIQTATIKLLSEFASLVFKLFVRIFYSSPPPIKPQTGKAVKITINFETPLAEVSNKYLSFSIDTAELLGGHRWSVPGTIDVGKGRRKTLPLNVTQQKLILLTSALSPAYLRIGGTEADNVIFEDITQRKNTLNLTRQTWDNLNFFGKQSGLELFFTVNAGPSVRNNRHQWQGKNLDELLRYSRSKGYEISAFELGNELNAFWFFHGFINRVRVKQYIQDFEQFKKVVRKYYPQAKVGGASTLYWPRIGEAFSFVGNIEATFIKYSKTLADMYTWHYYPQQSQRCPITFPKAKHGLLLNPQNLNDLGKWATQLDISRKKWNPHAELWIGEVGNALCGGQLGISDTFESSLWWTDVLGLMATKGQRVIVRQDLIGSDYSLLDKQTLTPRPDFWASLLWKKLMGSTVFQVNSSDDNPYIRVYAHSTVMQEKAVTVVCINMQEKENAIDFVSFDVREAILYQLTATTLNDKIVFLNGEPLRLFEDNIPVLKGKTIKINSNTFVLAPLSITYLVILKNGLRGRK